MSKSYNTIEHWSAGAVLTSGEEMHVHTRDHGGFRYTLHVDTSSNLSYLYLKIYHQPSSPTTHNFINFSKIFHNLQTQRMETSEEIQQQQPAYISIISLFLNPPGLQLPLLCADTRCRAMSWSGLGWCWAGGGDGALSLCWCQLTAVRHGPGPAEDQTHGELDTPL